MPENYRLEFLVANNQEKKLNSWITQILTGLSSQSQDTKKTEDTEENKSKLLYICTVCMKRLDFGARKGGNPHFWFDDRIELLQNIIRSALLLVNSALFRNALFIQPSKLPRHVFHDIGKKIDISKFDCYEKG